MAPLIKIVLRNLVTPVKKHPLIFSCHYSVLPCRDFKSKFGHINITSWFPGHMYKGMLQLQAKLAVVDCVIEVHDARIPFSGRNPKLYTMLAAIKPHILVLNKCDLIPSSYQEEIKTHLHKENIKNVVFTNCIENKKGIQKIVPLAVNLIKDSVFYNRGNRSAFMIMVVGIPNVGKSSVINRLRNYHLKKKKASAVGAMPGITKSVLEKIKVSEKPDIYLYDSPGIMQPSVEHLEIGFKLALCRTLKDTVVGPELVADYLLFVLNKHKNFSYVEYLKLKEPVDDVRYLIVQIAREFNKVKKVNNAQDTTCRPLMMFKINNCSFPAPLLVVMAPNDKMYLKEEDVAQLCGKKNKRRFAEKTTTLK